MKLSILAVLAIVIGVRTAAHASCATSYSTDEPTTTPQPIEVALERRIENALKDLEICNARALEMRSPARDSALERRIENALEDLDATARTLRADQRQKAFVHKKWAITSVRAHHQGPPSAVTWPLVAQAQQPAMPVIGLLSGTDREIRQLDAIWQGLNEAGYVEGRNVAVEYRWAEGHFDQLPALAVDLVRRQVAVIVAIQGAAAALAAKAATASIPIIFSIGGDPVKLGLVSSFNRPGGTVTGTSFLVNTLGAKRLELLRELVPSAAVIGLLVNPKNPSSESETSDVHVAARTLGLQIYVQYASSDLDIDAAFANFGIVPFDVELEEAALLALSR
jgi:phosphoribosylcarboxyaminoimidazole (NCAIR) mutase